MKQFLASVLLVAMCAPPATAATVTVTASGLTAKEADVVAWKLQQVNAQRAAFGLPPFANLKAYVEDYLVSTWFPLLIKEHADATREQQNIRALWENATPAQRAAAVTALGG